MADISIVVSKWNTFTESWIRITCFIYHKI